MNWDYTPSRELTGLFYPLFEYTFLIYVCLDFLQAKVGHAQGAVPSWVYRVALYLLPVKIILISWFRMIFIIKVDESANGHTLGFFGLQIALILVALQNVLYVNVLGYHLPCVGRKGTKILSWFYFIVFVPITGYKIAYSISMLMGRPFIDVSIPAQVSIVYCVDKLWMLLAAIMPVFFAQWQKRKEPPLRIRID